MISTVTVTVPGTTANLGPGFDCLGVALTLCNQFKFSLLSQGQGELAIKANGLESDLVKTDASNLVYQSFVKLYEVLDKSVPAVSIGIQLGVPLARGLGSSATAIVGGLVGANVLAGEPLSQKELLQLAVEIEGHPDNVVPALLGGCCLTASGIATAWEVCDVPWHHDVVPIVAIPNFELSTQEARRVLPVSYSRADAVFNIAHLGLLLRGLETGRAEWLKSALHDRIHQPYRQVLIPGFDAVKLAALEAGAYGLVISGAGPTLLALANAGSALGVEVAISEAWLNQGITAEVRALKVDSQGAISHAE